MRLALVIALVPVGRMARSVTRSSVDVPFNDQWSIAALMGRSFGDRSLGGPVRFSDLFAKHHEHRIFFPRLIMLGLAHMTRWNTRAELLVIMGLFVVMLLIIGRLMWAAMSTKVVSTMVALPLVSALLFSKTQAENVLWGWQLTLVLCVAAFIASISLIVGLPRNSTRNSNRKATRLRDSVRFVMALFSGVVSQYSFANGVLVWPIGLALLVSMSSERSGRDVRRIFVWCGAGLISTFAYFWHLNERSGFLRFFSHSKDSLNYALVFLGAPLTLRTFDCVPSGQRCGTVIADARLRGAVLLVALMVVAVRAVRNRIGASRPFLAMATFGVLSAALASMGRASLGTRQALESRYTTLSLTAWIGLVVLLALVISAAISSDGRSEKLSDISSGKPPAVDVRSVKEPNAGSVRTWLLLAIYVGLGIGYTVMTSNWQLWFAGRHDGLMQARAVVLKPNASDAELQPNNDPAAIRILSETLRRNGLSVFRNP